MNALSAKRRRGSAFLFFVLGFALPLVRPFRVGAGRDFAAHTPPPIRNSPNAPSLPSVVPSAGEELFGFAMADFGGDSRPDLAAVEVDRLGEHIADYRVYIRLTEGGEQNLRLTGPLGELSITPKDVTGDGSLDLVISSGSGDLVGIFVNDGKGHFDKANPADFAKDRGRRSSRSFLTTTRPYIIATFATLEGQAFHCRSEWIHFRRTNSRSLIPALESVRIQAFLYSGANRAPPSAA